MTKQTEAQRQALFIKFWNMNRHLSFGQVLDLFRAKHGMGPNAL